ncbi:ABC transporter permease [Parasediminibacterium sp. JCM 36343]|uniref:ABC transporter permease n=1 Tax=Parasediminibacterium sp. JCM 36343 TaxID=3374279 RepID=UPI00397BFF48
MNISFIVAKKIAFNRQQSFSKFIIHLSIAATGLSVMAMIVTLAFVNGFQQTVSGKVFSFWGHIHAQHFEGSKSLVAEETPILKNDSILHIIQQQNGVAHVDEYATKSAVLEKNKSIEGVLVKGVAASYQGSRLAPFMKKGHWIHFNDTSYSKEILISEPIANSLDVAVNDTIRMHFIASKQGESSTYRKLVVAGIYKTGIEEYDKLFVIADIKLLQRLNNWLPTQIGGYEIFLTDYKMMDTISNRLSDNLPPEWVSRSTKEIYPNIFDWLNIQDVNRNVVFVIMAIVAIINLITCLLVLVLERTRMVGILKAIGTPNWHIQQIFLYYATLITMSGICVGLVTGLGICWLEETTHFIHLDETSYYVSYAPMLVIGWQVAAVCVATAFVCFLSLIVPTLVVKKMQPVKAIQFR